MGGILRSAIANFPTRTPGDYAFLEHSSEHGGSSERFTLTVLPATIGRAETNDLRVVVPAVSKQHAVFLSHAQGCCIRDLGSTNGTFVNGRRVTECVLTDGDIIHLGPVEFCFRLSALHSVARVPAETTATQALPRIVPRSVIRGAEQLRELIDSRAVEIVYQPIVDLETKGASAFEALARGCHPGLTRSPAALLEMAEECGLVVELSQLFRTLAVEQARTLPRDARLFLNIHPRELDQTTFLSSLRDLREHQPDQRVLVLEIAEASVTNVQAMAQTRDAFATLGFEFAYDDFGAGQARLLELTEIPPHFLKLDVGVIRGIEAAVPRQEVVRALLGVVGTLGVRVIAEGIETESCAQMCRELGCHLGQGYLFGRPVVPLRAC
jgi:EAL domain-containing protein (putative c-di-GMP-specific phosphodiesterase class I)